MRLVPSFIDNLLIFLSRGFSNATGKQKRDPLIGYIVFRAQYSMEGVVWKGLYNSLTF